MAGFVSHYYSGVTGNLMRALCSVTECRDGEETFPDMYRTRVLTGLLRGKRFTMPRLERLSFCLGTYEKHLAQQLQAYLKPGYTAYDVGANAGYFSLFMAQCVGPTGRIYAFEPDTRNLCALRNNIHQNTMHHVVLVSAAVSEQTGSIEFATFDCSLVGHIAHEGTPGDARRVRVPTVSLDDFVYASGMNPPSLIKIDVEGAETKVFLGAERVFAEARPIVLAEIRQGETWQTVSSLMTRLRYDIMPIGGKWTMHEHGLAELIFLPKD